MTTEPLPQTLPEMEARRDVVEEEIASLKAKIEKVQADKHLTGKWADPDWYRRAKARLRFTGLEHQKLTRAIADAKRDQRKAHAASLQAAFVDVAREVLTEGMFAQVMSVAQARAAQ